MAEAMQERIKEALQRNFAGAQVHLRRDEQAEKVNGYVLWEGFSGHDFLWRQNSLYRVLRREFGPEAQAISHLFTYTPNEYEQMAAA